MKKFFAVLVTAAVTLGSCAGAPAFALNAAPPKVAAPTTAYVIVAHWKGKDGEQRDAPYAPNDKVVLFANEASCKTSLEAEAVQTSINGLKLLLLMREGEDAMESLVVDCQPASTVRS